MARERRGEHSFLVHVPILRLCEDRAAISELSTRFDAAGLLAQLDR